ncbi:M56 family metallopeptidase [Butyrivibrio sp. FC2001]|uniref:M56 family metallopeptidase n=1 Tax=Butyrivibrio sp. FC2001 TaxID=1280671 RepID=UPI00047B60EC|nr:M56 family metallopeptidase [Butyrivibrio sp. FC2001]
MISISTWSVFTAMFFGTAVALTFHIAVQRDSNMFSAGMTPWIAAFVMLLVRIIIPIETCISFVIPSRIVMTGLNDFLNSRIGNVISIGSLLIVIWIAGAAFAIGFWGYKVLKNRNSIRLLIIQGKELPKEYAFIARSAGLDPKKIVMSEFIEEAVSVGVINYGVILPAVDYSDLDIRNILFHEASHIKHRDVLTKMLLHLASCILWWNPVLRLLEVDFEMLSERRCDEAAVRGYSQEEKISYIETMKKMAVIRAMKPYGYSVASFSGITQKRMLVSRARRVFFDIRTDKRKNSVIIMLGLVLLFASYVPVIQPLYDPPYVEDEIFITKDNAYLQLTPDGYDLYVDGELFEQHIPKKELKVEPYNMLEIRK